MVIKMEYEKKKIKLEKKDDTKIVPCIIVFVVLFLFVQRKFYQKDGAILWERLFQMTAWTALFVWLLLEHRVEALCKKYQKISACVMFAVMPVLLFYNLEIMCNSELKEFGRKKIVMNLLIIYLLGAVLLLLINRTRTTLKILTVLLTALGVTNIYLMKFRGMSLMAADFFSIKTAANVANNYNYSLKWRILYGVYVAFLFWMMLNKVPSHKAFEKKVRIGYLTITVCCVGIFYGVFFHTNFVKDYVRVKMRYSASKKQGNMLTLLYSVKQMQVEKPDGYSEEELKSLMASYEKEAEEYNEGLNSRDDVNIIAIMNEAFSDLAENVELTEDNMPYIHGLTENTIKGNMYTSVFAGNTANTEFEFLTGNTMAFVPPNTIPYQLYVRGKYPSLTRTLQAQDYQGNVAIHPFKRNGFNRPNAYTSLGFETFLDQDAFADPTYVREYISDSSSFQKIIECYEQTRQKPFFAFNVTMQNHSGYDYGNFDTPIQLKDAPGKYKETEQYLNLIKKSDEAFEELTDYFSQVNEKTIIVMFGDHRPGVESSYYDRIAGKPKSQLSDEEYMQRYKVPFIIWANYDIDEAYLDRISANYLSSLVLETAGCEMTGYQNYLSDLRDDIPAITARGYWGENGTYYELDDEASPYWDEIQEYHSIQYNNMFDERETGFFFLNK